MGIAGNAGGDGGRRSGRSRVRRVVVREADNFGASNDESIEIVGVNVGERISIVHSRETGEFAGGWLVSASVLNVNLDAAWVVLGRADGMESNNFIANQVLPRSQPSWNSGSPFVAVSDQLIRGPLSIRISTLIDLEPLTAGSCEGGTVSIARSHESGNGALVITQPGGPLESHVTSCVDVESFVRSDITALVASNVGA